MGGACCAEETPQTEVVDPGPTAVQPRPVAKPAIGDEFTVTLRKTGDQKLGLDISHFDENRSLKIKRVKEGMVQTWNEANSSSLVESDDVIVSINGVKDSSEGMLKKVKESDELVLVVKKGGAK